MLDSVDKIDRVGVFRSTDGTCFKFGKLALVYGGNGCGKSTLTAILRAAGESDNEAITVRQAIGTTNSAFVKLTSQEGSISTFQNGSWRGTPMSSWIFDSEFVERNVHSAGAVHPVHRANLLEFAIGDSAVSQQRALSDAQKAADSAKTRLANNEQSILAHAQAVDRLCNFEKFEKLQALGEIESALAAAEANLVAGKNAGKITALPMPKLIAIPSLSVPDLSDSLTTTLDDIHERARNLVSSHIETLGDEAKDAEAWIARGLALTSDSHCPLCGQKTDDVEIFQMYGHFFNDAYGTLRERVDAIESAVGPVARSRIAARVHSEHEQALTSADGWRTYVDLPEVPSLDGFDRAIEDLGRSIDSLLNAKRQRLEQSVGSNVDFATIASLVGLTHSPVLKANEEIEAIFSSIEQYKLTLAPANLPMLEQHKSASQLAVTRKSTEVLRLFEVREKLRAELRTFERDAQTARASLKLAMETTLGQFEKAINVHLAKLGAAFSIEKVTPNFKGGGAARSNYALRLKGKSIDISKGEPPFRSVLSEGDKRTLAFAFFCVTVLAQPDLRGHTVVVDDPVTSLDNSRRRHTTAILDLMSQRGAQLIVLAHDPGYLREVRMKVAKSGSAIDGSARNVTEFQLSQDAEGHSSFAAVDLDAECESDYYRNYRRIRCFLENELFNGAVVSHTEAGESIRPLIESYLHRRFPGRIPATKRTLGSVINFIRDSPSDSVLHYAKSLDAELRDLNDFGTRYHHDADSDFPQPKPDAREVRTHALRSFAIVHGAPVPF